MVGGNNKVITKNEICMKRNYIITSICLLLIMANVVSCRDDEIMMEEDPVAELL